MLDGKVIAVTGVSSGIGAATARRLRRAGAQVIGFDLKEPNECDRFIRLDIADPNSSEAVSDAFDIRLDGLCNIAGLPPTFPAERVLKVNFFGLRHFTNLMVRHLNDGSPILNCASLAGYNWRANLLEVRKGLETALNDVDHWIAHLDTEGARSYHLSKELVIAWTILDSGRWKSRGIRMNSISPGPVSTPILDDFIKTLGERAARDLSLNRAATPEEIASVFAFLCSDESSWMNGADVAVDGGAGAAVWSELLQS